MEAQARGGSSGTTPEEDLSEVLDDDKLVGEYPPDQPLGSFDYGVTPQEQRVPEALADRVARERPDDVHNGAPRHSTPPAAPSEHPASSPAASRTATAGPAESPVTPTPVEHALCIGLLPPAADGAEAVQSECTGTAGQAFTFTAS